MTPTGFEDARVWLGLRQPDVGRLLGCAVTTVQRWEQGLRAVSPVAARLMLLLVLETEARERSSWTRTRVRETLAHLGGVV